jgi:hypothetical protein
MAHDSNRIYIGSTGIEIADIQVIFSSTRNDIGGLVTNGTINEWAKYKPTRANGVNPTDPWKGERKSIYWSATQQYTYGFSLKEYSSLATMKTDMNNNDFGWVYERPRGASYGTNGEYFRFMDVNGYIKNATSPFFRFGLQGEDFPTIDTFPAYLYVDFTRSTAELAAGDFDLFDEWYFGVAVYGGGSGQLVGKGTSTEQFGQQSDAARCVTMILPVRAQGTCYLYPFFSYHQIAWSDSASEPAGVQRYIPLPIGKETINVVSGGAIAGLDFDFGTGGSVVYVATNGRLTINFPALSVMNTNNSQKQITKSNIYYQVYIQKMSDPSSNWRGDMTTMGLSGPLQIAAGATETVFSSGTSKVLNNPSGTGTIAGSSSTMNLFDFIANVGGSFSTDYGTSVLMWYYDPDHVDYLPIDATFVYP